MKGKSTLHIAAAVVILVGILGAALSLLRQTVQAGRFPKVVRIEGVDACYNASLSFVAWVASRAADRPTSLLARDGDLLIAIKDGHPDREVAFPYLASDGTSLSVEFADSRGLLGGETVCLELSKDGRGWEWLQKATPKELTRLRVLEFGEDVESPRMPGLRRLAQVNPRIGLMIDSGAALRRVLPLFRPRWLIVMGSLEKGDLATISSKDGLEFLWIEAKDIESLAFLARLPDLRRLVLTDWVTQETGPFPSGCEGLESLTIFEADMKDLSPIGHLTGLRELHLMGCESLTDITALSKFSALEALRLTLCEHVRDLSVLKKLQGLTRLGLPPGISQEEFIAVTGNHPDLREIELVGCEKINGLGPLKGLPELEHLVLLGPKASYAPLYEMRSLRFLVLPKEVFEKSPEEVRKLDEALPECVVAAGGPFCLGSGWILTLLPAVALARLLSRRRGERDA